MGTFIREYGEVHIPGEKREAFLEDVRTVALQGGLFRRDCLSVFGKNIVLLGAAEAGDEDGCLDFTYSYYEDDRWENAGINLKECRPYSNKVGWRQFNQAVQAVHILAELYSDTPCFSLNDSYNRPAGTIQWLRYVLKRELHYTWRNHIWNALEMAAQDQAEYGDAPVIKPDFVYKIAGDEADGMELLDAVVVTSDLKEFLPKVRKAASDQEKGIISYSYALAALYDEVTAFKESSSMTEEEQIAYLFRFLSGFDARKEKEMLDKHTRIAVMTTVLSPPISVKVISELYGKNFWTLWWQIKDSARKERAVSAEGLKEVEEYREMDTEEFFHVDHRDRLYWWKRDGDVEIPDDIRTWLQEMQQRHAGLCAGVSPDTPSWQKRFVALLARRSDVFCFEQMFFEFMGHFHEAEYCAAVALLEECADNRTKYRRLLAVMANEELREEAFQF